MLHKIIPWKEDNKSSNQKEESVTLMHITLTIYFVFLFFLCTAWISETWVGEALLDQIFNLALNLF